MFCQTSPWLAMLPQVLYVCLYTSGKEERSWPITGGEIINQSINQSLAMSTDLAPNMTIDTLHMRTRYTYTCLYNSIQVNMLAHAVKNIT